MKNIKGLNLIFFNISFYFVFCLYSAIAIPILTLLVAYFSLFMSHRNTMKWFRRAISWYGMVAIKVLPFPLITIDYKDYEKNAGPGPYIFVCNHRASTDPFLMACLPHEFIQVVNIWPFRLPVLGIYARWASYLSINEMSFKQFSKQAMKLLKQDVSIIVFPEGTRSGGKSMSQFHGSIFRVAIEANCPIVPVCISGNENIPPRGSFLLRPGKIKIHKLPAIKWEEYKDLKPFKLKNIVRDIMSKELSVMDRNE